MDYFFLFPGLKLSTASIAAPQARLLSDDSNNSSPSFQTEHFWWIMRCQPSPRWAHLNKCRFEIYWKMRPTCQSDTQLHANAPYFEAVAFQKMWNFTNFHAANMNCFPMLISFIQVAVTPHIACCHIALTGSNDCNSDFVWDLSSFYYRESFHSPSHH